MSERYEGQTYYELLEVSPLAGPTEIYNAYQRARSTYSPSSPALYTMFTPEEAQELRVLIEEAYLTLSHQARRRDYDSKLGMADPKRSDMPGERVAARSPQDQWIGPVKIVTRPQQVTPEGHGRTKFSVYQIKAEFETEIAAIEECDGEFLQRIRLYKGVSIDQMSEEIRVIKTTLLGLEANDLKTLPVAVFTRGFVVQYARVLGLDEHKITNAYMKFFKARKGAK